MKTSTTVILGTTILWAGTLIGSYQLGCRHLGHGTAESDLGTTSVATRGSMDSHGESANAARDRRRTSDKALSAKQFFLQIKSIMRPGMTQNPSAMLHAMALLDKLRPEEIGDALNETEKLKDKQSKIMVSMMLLAKWAENNGPAAMKYAEEHSKESGMFSSVMKMSVVSAWAGTDPDTVWQWYNNNKNKDSGGNIEDNQMVVSSILSNLMSTNPDAAFQRLEELDPNTRKMAFMGMCQSALVDDDKRQLMLDKINAMTDETEKTTSRQMLLSQWATFSPDDATAWVSKQPAADQQSLRESVGSALMMSDPKKGAAFMMEGVSTEDKPQRYSEVVGTWSMMDPKAAAAWLDTQGSGPELDNARQTLVSTITKSNPEGAMSQAQAITDADQRFSYTSMVYSVWSKKDPAAADKALDSAGLTAEQVQSLRSSHQQGSP